MINKSRYLWYWAEFPIQKLLPVFLIIWDRKFHLKLLVTIVQLMSADDSDYQKRPSWHNFQIN